MSDPRLSTLERIITIDTLLTGQVASEPIRLPAIGRILGVSLWRRHELLTWLVQEVGYLESPYTGPLADRPNAGAFDLAKVAAAIRNAYKKNDLPSFITLTVGIGSG